jgi:hypothetical protein
LFLKTAIHGFAVEEVHRPEHRSARSVHYVAEQVLICRWKSRWREKLGNFAVLLDFFLWWEFAVQIGHRVLVDRILASSIHVHKHAESNANIAVDGFRLFCISEYLFGNGGERYFS